MKRLHIHIVVLALLTVMPATARHGEQTNVQVINSSLTRTNNLLDIKLTLDCSQLDLSSNEQLKIQPVLTGSQDTVRLPYLLLPGENREKVNRRKADLYGAETSCEQPHEIIPFRKDGNTTLEYHRRIPFDNWMYGSHLFLDREITGCADCRRTLARVPAGYVPNRPRTALVVPAPQVKKHEEVITAFLNFRVARYNILPDFRQNTTELERINRSVEALRKDTNLVPLSIVLKGYASPEGSYAYNTRLSANRAKALENYIEEHHPIDKELFTLEAESEDWEGLIDWLNTSDIAYKNELLKIIAQTENPDARDAKIRQLDGGATYAWLLKNVYPPLRRVDYILTYIVRPFTAQEALMILQTGPEQLNLYELYLAAGNYPPGSDKFYEIMEIAAQRYPDETAACNNAAAAALNRGDLKTARQLLERIKNDPAAQNNWGVLLWQEGNTGEALEYFRFAKDTGCKEAGYNLTELEKTYNKQ